MHMAYSPKILHPETVPWSIQGVETLIMRHPILSDRWHYEPGVALLAGQRVWELARDHRYFEYIQRNISQFVDQSGNIRTYTLGEYNLDQINQGKLLFLLYTETGEARYKKAAFLLREQLRTHPRNRLGGFWHKQIYLNQMWLDGLYMAAPFLTQFAGTFDDPDIFEDVAHQVILFDRHARDPKTGLLYHAWDCTWSQQWANPQTGCSPNFWARAMGWFTMALLDILDHFPKENPQRETIAHIFRRTTDAILTVQDESSGVWYQILDQPERPGNYLEASASCMFVYALAKGVRLGVLDPPYMEAANKGYQGILDHFVTTGDQGYVDLNHICSVGGLGGNPYRDGSFEYYISEPVVSNDYKGFGPFIMSSVEIERVHEKTGSQL